MPAHHITTMSTKRREPALGQELDLFATPILPGFSLAENCLLATDEQMLIAAIDAIELSPFRFQGWQGKRLTASFGSRYDFDTSRLTSADPIPGWLLPLREAAARFAGLPSTELAHALLTRYDPGAGIGWHRDRLVYEHVVGVSLGASATMRFRRRRAGGFDRTSILLPARSIYHIAGEARHAWEHSIAQMDVSRWSITFRSLATLDPVTHTGSRRGS